MMPAGPHLRDIHLPPPASWWPLAPGWWILVGIALLLLAWLIWRGYRRRLPRRRWQAASRELDALKVAHATDHDDAAFAAGISQLLRRSACIRDPASVGLRGQAWHAAMRDLSGKKELAPALLTLEDAMYRPTAALDVSEVTSAARLWLRSVLIQGRRHA